MATVVLVHGLAGSARWWAPVEAALRERFVVRALDLPRGRLTDAPAYVREHIPASAHLVGHSLGGLVCARVAARWPDAVERLVLVAPAGVGRRPLLGNVVPLARTLVRARPSFVRLAAADALRSGPVSLMRTARDLLADDVAADLPEIAAPTLLVWGERDALVPAALAPAFVERLRDARLVLIRDAAHVPMIERPREFTDVVLDFLD